MTRAALLPVKRVRIYRYLLSARRSRQLLRPDFDFSLADSVPIGYGGGAFHTSKYIRGRRGRKTVIPAYNRGYTRIGGYYGAYSSGLANELKFHDIDVNDASILVGGTILNTGTINIIAQGNTESTRIGRKSVIRQINWRYTLTLGLTDATATPGVGEVVRLILYLDKQCNGATAAILDILDTANFQSFNQLANKNRFRILMDRTHDLNRTGLASDNAAVVSTPPTVLSGSFYKKCKIPIEFDNSAPTGVLTSMRSNNLCVLAIAQTGSTSTLDSKFRLRFTDS